MTVIAAKKMLPFILEVFGEDWNDPSVEDIFVVKPGGYFIKKQNKTEWREAPTLDALSVYAIAATAGHLRGQYADEGSPLMDCELDSGERLSIVLPPCTPVNRPSLSLRRASAAIPRLEDLDSGGLWEIIKNKEDVFGLENGLYFARKFLEKNSITDFLKACIKNRLSIAFVGETGSGKTHDATAMVMEIPLEDRIITVADTEEWARLPHLNRVSLLHHKGGPITGEMLIEAALRMAPRWLLVQEVRDGAAFAFLRALASGHPGITTWHARSADTAFDALSVMVRQHPAGARIPEDALRMMFRSFIDVVVHVERNGLTGQFRATEIRFGKDL